MSYSETTLLGKRILITGAARGIGKSCALACAKLGAEVIAADLSADELSSLIEESGGTSKHGSKMSPLRVWQNVLVNSIVLMA